MKRDEKLLISTANELREGRAPLNEAWILANEVAIDEADALAENLVSAIHIYRAVIKMTLKQSTLSGKELEGKSLAEHVAYMALLQSGPAGVLAMGLKLEAEAELQREESAI